MKAEIFNQKLISSLKNRKDIVVQKFTLQYKNRRFEFLRIASRQFSKKDRIIFITAGFHGNEKAGPLSILKYANKIIDYAHKNNLKIIIYPLINPSGFEKNTRYNIDNDKGDVGNNDFIRYELKNGKIIDDLGAQKSFKKWYWSSDKKFKVKMPKETQLVHKLLKKEPLKHVIAMIDLHQDHFDWKKSSFTYQYSFENYKVFNGMVKKIAKIVPILRHGEIHDGFILEITMKTNENGFIIRHDGSITDLLCRTGIKYSIAIETTGTTPINKAMLVNLTWIIEIINLINSKQNK